MRPSRFLRVTALVAVTTPLFVACSPGTTTPASAPGAVPTTTAAAAVSSSPAPAPGQARTQTTEPSPTPNTTTSAASVPSATIPGARALVATSGPSPDGSAYELSGLVLGVIEDGGTCTYTLVLGSTTVSRSQQGIADARDTSCGTVDVPLTDLTAGTWTVTLLYAGPSGTATSVPDQVVVK